MRRGGNDRTRRRRRHRLVGALLAVAIVVAAPIVWWLGSTLLVYLDDPATDPSHRARMLEIVAESQPEGENGWPRLAVVLGSIDARREAMVVEAIEASPVPEDVEAASERAERRAVAEGLDDLRAALAAPRFVRPWQDDGLEELLPLVSVIRATGEALVADADEAFASGAWADAVDRLALAHRLADVCSRQPSAIHAMTAWDLERLGLAAMREAAVRAEMPPDVAVELNALVAGAAAPDVPGLLDFEELWGRHRLAWLHGTRGYLLPLPELFEAEWFGGLAVLPVVDPENDQRSFGAAVRSRWAMATREETAEYQRRTYETWRALARRPYRVRRDAQRWPMPRTALGGSSPATAVPHLGRAVDRADHLLAERGATRLVLALERFRADRGELPSSLLDLAPGWIDALPVDPIAGGSFGYQVAPDEASGYLLFSYGIDRARKDGAGWVEWTRDVDHRDRDGADVVFSRPTPDDQNWK